MQENIKIEKIIDLSGHTSSIYGLADHIDSPYFYSTGGDGWIVRWQKGGSETDGLLVAKTDAKLFCLEYIKSHQLLIAGDINGLVYWIDLTTNSVISRIDHHKGSVFAFKILNENRIISLGKDGFICFWDLESRLPKESIRISNQALRCIEIDHEKQVAYIGSSDNNLYVFDLATKSVIKTIDALHENSIFNIQLLDGNRLLTGGRDAIINVLNITDLENIHHFPAHWFTVNCIQNIPSLKAFVTASRDKTFRIWSSVDYKLLKSIDVFKDGHVNSINAVLYFEDYNHLVTAGDDRIIKIWKLGNQII